MSPYLKKITSLIPFAICCGIIVGNWYGIASTTYKAPPGMIAATVLIAMNLFLYFWRFLLASWFTSLILLLCTFCILSLTYIGSSWSVGVGKLNLPSINTLSLLLLISQVMLARNETRLGWKKITAWW